MENEIIFNSEDLLQDDFFLDDFDFEDTNNTISFYSDTILDTIFYEDSESYYIPFFDEE
jgi:hypothetical protein